MRRWRSFRYKKSKMTERINLQAFSLPENTNTMAIGAIIGAAATGIGGSVLGAIQSANAAKQQRRLIRQQQAQQDAWYNRNYYQNYLDSSEAQAAIKRVEQTMRRRNQEAQARAAITGGTHEQVAAKQANDQQMMGDTLSNLAAQGDAVRRQVDQQYQGMSQNNNNLLLQQAMMDEEGKAQLMQNGLGIIGNALQLYYTNKK